MKKVTLLGLLILAFGFNAAVFAVPQYINFQGVLRDTSGNLVTGTKSMTFAIYDDATGGTEQFSMTSPEVTVSNGLYTVQLGPMNETVLGSGSRWVEVTVGSEVMSPRLEILSVAYAITTGSAGSAPYATVSGTATTAATATNAEAVDGLSASATPTASQLYPLDAEGKISGIAVSTEASTGFALFAGGRIGAAENICVGTGSIPGGSGNITINNTNVTANSRIFLTMADTTYNYAFKNPLRIKTITPGTSFVVETLDGGAAHATNPTPFFYLIIN